MKRLCILGLILWSMVPMISAYGQISLIKNGSFEQDGIELTNIIETPPLFWCDVNISDDEFTAKLTDKWSTHDGNDTALSCELKSKLFGIEAGDTASISQSAFLEQDIAGISFDLYLRTASGLPWDHNEQTALVMIDGNVIWDSNSLPIDSNGEYKDAVYIGFEDFQQYMDNDWHKLSLAMKYNVPDPWYQYISRWDFVKFDKYCGGLGFLYADLNQDCYVDLADYALIALDWMGQPTKPRYDLEKNEFININDLKLLAEDWALNTDWTVWGQAGTRQMELLANDFDLSGQIDIGDFQTLSEYWLTDKTCSGADLYQDGIINLKDFAILAEQLGVSGSWIYYKD